MKQREWPLFLKTIAFSETGQLSVTSTADLHSPSSAVCDVLNVMHVRMASLSEDNLWSAFSETGLSFPQLSVTSTADLHSPSSVSFLCSCALSRMPCLLSLTFFFLFSGLANLIHSLVAS